MTRCNLFCNHLRLRIGFPLGRACFRSSGLTILCRSKIALVLCPEIIMATLSGMPARTISLTAVLLKSWKYLLITRFLTSFFPGETEIFDLLAIPAKDKRTIKMPVYERPAKEITQFVIQIYSPALFVFRVANFETSNPQFQIYLIPRQSDYLKDTPAGHIGKGYNTLQISRQGIANQPSITLASYSFARETEAVE